MNQDWKEKWYEKAMTELEDFASKQKEKNIDEHNIEVDENKKTSLKPASKKRKIFQTLKDEVESGPDYGLYNQEELFQEYEEKIERYKENSKKKSLKISELEKKNFEILKYNEYLNNQITRIQINLNEMVQWKDYYKYKDEKKDEEVDLFGRFKTRFE